MEHARMIAAQRQAKDDEIERLTRENEELRKQLAALKQESAEPVFWVHPMDIARFPSVTLVKVSDEQIPLITQDQATALVEDFKRRVKEALVNANESSLVKTDENWEAFDKFTSDSIATIESLPLIEGEKK